MDLNEILIDSNALNVRLSRNLITQSCGDHFREYINKWQSHKKRKDSMETRTVLYYWYFCLSLKYLGWPYKAYIKTAKKGDFWEELLSKNDFEAVLATFCCFDHGAKASEAVHRVLQFAE